MVLHTEKVKKYFWFLFGVMGVVFFWTGLWDGVGNIGYLANPLVSLGVGVLMLTLSSFIFKDVTPLDEIKQGEIIYDRIHRHPSRQELSVTYLDKASNKIVNLPAHNLKKLEKDFLVFVGQGGEIFIPANRIKEITHNGQTYWKAPQSA